jgi:hypothetical protein
MVKRTNPFAKYALSAKKAKKYMRVPRTRFSNILTSSRRGPEIKSVDVANNTYACNTTGLVVPLNLIQAGSSFYNRVGRRCENISIHMTGMLIPTTNITTVPDYVRVMIIYDRQTNGVLPTVANIFSTYDQAGNQASSTWAGINPDQRERYVILADERRTPPPNSGSGVYSPTDGTFSSFQINRFRKLQNLLTHYQADSAPAVIGDITTGGLFLVTYGAFSSGTAPYQVHLNFRLRFTDV